MSNYETHVGTVRKQPSETTDVTAIGFGAHLSSGDSIASFVLTVADDAGNDTTGTMLLDSAKTDTEVQFRIQGGEHGKRYLVTIVATLSNGSVVEREVTVLVFDNKFASTEISFTVGSVLPLVTEALGTNSESGPLSQANKISAIYRAYERLLTVRKPEEAFAPDWILNFSGQKASLPPSYLIWIKLVDATDTKAEYRRVSVNEFDKLSGYYWTIKRDDYGQMKLHVAREVSALRMRYIEQPTVFSTVNDVIYLPKYYQQPIAEMAAANVSRNARDYADAAAKQSAADNMLDETGSIHAEQQRHAAEARIRSIYDDEDLFADSI